MEPLPDLPAPPRDLVDHLHAQRLVNAHPRFATLYGGRTNKVWKVKGRDSDKVLKLYSTALRNPLFRNDAELEALCLKALGTTGFVPRLRATGQYKEARWVFYDHAPGAPWRQDSAQVGALLRKLHTLPIAVQAPAGCNGSADLRAHGKRILQGCTSNGRDKLADLQPSNSVAPTQQTCLIHGDPVAGNILVATGGLTLIDWQCPALGDPCEDLALFLSPAMQQLYRGSPLSKKEEDQFLSAYGRPEIVARYEQLRPWYAWRMATYCLWRAENGAPDYATGLNLETAIL
ncbi:phosphotransferase [Ruegeria sp. THAF33]|jgi:aminoglycoside phosphotransferase (APT) family kinase protein|uniref:phosphotransferase n=1 Tax=Ruegeria sp. THAF33 TaxID=2587853 RepID=UPI001267ED13|nr:phosphotransferase [Ruegeria sp. THAF33]QFT74300.1 Phosphotransferase enzyme family protein [Ruegeria sp. THAF33]